MHHGRVIIFKLIFLKVHFSSLNLKWKTPKELYKKLDAEFNFNYDPCPVDPDFDGLVVSWGSRSFVNPPYGREIQKWIKKGYEEHLKNKLVVFLIPSRTDTRYFHDYIMKANEIRFIKGRLHFSEKGPAPFPSCIVVFKKKVEGAINPLVIFVIRDIVLFALWF